MNRAWYEKHRWRLSKGIPETQYDYFKELKDTQWSDKFESLMRNRLIIGALRYNKPIGTSKKSKYDFIHSIERRTQLFKETGNAEYLADIANYALLEFINESHPNFHFEAIDDGEHSILKK
jgi:hypothetical protein